ncbi:hypothetical protein DVH24_007959 [Malus domestica]|uniref:At2g35280-like TPR domain-containing protein n=1 Tax=Malus domestica TaxID=3750 RepID=A0A498JHX3_MALDO|nr:hypothetical protein DVH24_007959 [Malus domestica]
MMKKRHTTYSSMQSNLFWRTFFSKFSSSLLPGLLFRVSKKFNRIAKDPCIDHHINIIDFETVNPLRSWGTRCFFRDNKEEAEIERLKSAMSEGHQVATYVYSAILVYHRWDSSTKGSDFSILSTVTNRDGFWVDREVRAQILKLHDDNAAMKPCRTVEVHKVRLHSERIGMHFTMKN